MITFRCESNVTAGSILPQKLSGRGTGLVIVGLALASAMATAQTRLDLGQQSRNVDFSTATKTLPMKTGTTLPAQCTAGEMFFKTNGPVGGNLYGCASTNTWSKQGGDVLPGTAGQAGSVLGTDGTQAQWIPLGGDVTGSISGNAVVKIQGRAVANTAPSSGQTLVWNGSAARWEPQTMSGGGGGGGPVTIQVGGGTVGTQNTLSFLGGAGATVVGSDTGTAVQIQYLSDTAVLQTKSVAQSGAGAYCLSASASQTAYSCALSPTLSAYTTGMVVNWRPDTNNSVGATLDVDALGAVPLRKANGANISSGDAVANQLYAMWFDGTGFRIMSDGGSGGGVTTLGTLSHVWCPLRNCQSSRDTRMPVAAGRTYFFRFYPDRSRQLRRITVPLYPWNGSTDTLAIGIFNATGTKLGECNTRSTGINPSGSMPICSLSAALTIDMDSEYVLAVASETAGPQLDCTADGLAYELHTLWNSQGNFFPSSKALFGYGSGIGTGSGTGFALPATLGTETGATQCAPQFIFLPQ